MGCGSSKARDVTDPAEGKNRGKGSSSGQQGGHPLHFLPNGTGQNSSNVDWFAGAVGPLSAAEYRERLSCPESTQVWRLPNSGYVIKYVCVSLRGYYPENPYKANQDAFCAIPGFGGDPDALFFGVFDGHGEYGTEISNYARDHVPVRLINDEEYHVGLESAIVSAFVETNDELHRSDIDDTMSGTTAITILVRGMDVYVANVGDSRAFMAEEDPVTGALTAEDLSHDQTPYRRDECDRVRRAGAVVMTLDQLEGLKNPRVDCWTTEMEDDGDPPRLWLPNAMFPGTAFTRSIGDSVAERIGVVAVPEICLKRLGPQSRFAVIASDGVFEFLASQNVTDILAKFKDPLDGARAVVSEAYRLWLENEMRTDDITIVVICVEGVPPEALGHGQRNAPATWLPPYGTSAATAIGLAPPTTTHPPALSSLRASTHLAASSSSTAPSPLLTPNQVPPPTSSLAPPQLRDLSSLVLPLSSSAATAVAVAAASESIVDDPDELADFAAALRSNLLFARLEDHRIGPLFRAATRLVLSPGDVVVRQGDIGDSFYIVKDGTLDVYVSSTTSTSGGNGGNGASLSLSSDATTLVHSHTAADSFHPSFGALALLYDCPRAATVVARTYSTLWVLDRLAFLAHVKRGAPRWLLELLRGIDSLRALNSTQLDLVANLMEELCFEDGQVIVQQGAMGDALYVVTLGQVDVTVQDEDETASGAAAVAALKKEGSFTKPPVKSTPSNSRMIMSLGVNQYFGERSLLGDARRGASAIARGYVRVRYISRLTLERMLGASLADLDAAREVWLQRCMALAERRRSARLPLVTEAGGMRIVQRAIAWPEDTASASSSAVNAELLVNGTLAATDYTALVRCVLSPQATTLTPPLSSPSTSSPPPRANPSESLIARVTSLAHPAAESLLSCRAVMSLLDATYPCSFIPPTLRIIRDDKLVVELVHCDPVCSLGQLARDAHAHGSASSGGVTLSNAAASPLPSSLSPLPPHTRRFSEESVRYLAACVALTLDHLHRARILYRSLSPHGIVLTRAGHVALVDFCHAMSLETGARVHGLHVANLTYAAPEMLLDDAERRAAPRGGSGGRGYAESVDWWSLGVLIYTLLAGRPPFVALSPDALATQLLTGPEGARLQPVAMPPLPQGISPEAQALCAALLTIDPIGRLGCGGAGRGVAELRTHPWFRTVRWEKIEGMQVPLPAELLDLLGNESVTDVPLPRTFDSVPFPMPSWLDKF